MGTDVSSFLQALNHYNSQDYQAAISAFDAISIESEYFASALLYKGVSHMALQHDQQAIVILEGLQEHKDVEKEVVNWYLSLAYVNNGEQEKAIPILEEMINNEASNYKKSKAKSLLKKIK